MTDTDSNPFADAFNDDPDPLSKFEETFERIDMDALEYALDNHKELRKARYVGDDGLTEETRGRYRLVWGEWTEHLAGEHKHPPGASEFDRHPACPSVDHARSFIRWLVGKGNSQGYINEKMLRLNKVYRFWQASGDFPHTLDFNPIQEAMDTTPTAPEPETDGGDGEGNDDAVVPDHIDVDGERVPFMKIDVLRSVVADIRTIRDRAVIVSQLKCGLRAGEITNIQLQDAYLGDGRAEIHQHYSELGSNPKLKDHEQAIYVPSKYERRGNKSKRSRVLPLDDEMRQALSEWLLIRPDTGSPWLFLTDKHQQLSTETVRRLWNEEFWSRLPKDKKPDNVASHYGRHYFTHYWGVEKEMNRHLVQRMRGDVVGGDASGKRDTIDSYLEGYYPEIEEFYRARVYDLGLL